MKIKSIQNQLREMRKSSKKTECKGKKKPPSIEINHRGIGNNIGSLNES